MFNLDKSRCISDSSAKPEDVLPPICVEWWHSTAIAWMSWDVPLWFDRFMRFAFSSTWRGMFPNFVLQHFLYTGEWEIYFTMWGHPYGTVYRQKFAKIGDDYQEPNGWCWPCGWPPPSDHVVRLVLIVGLFLYIIVKT